jgi:hypothetical protein
MNPDSSELFAAYPQLLGKCSGKNIKFTPIKKSRSVIALKILNVLSL